MDRIVFGVLVVCALGLSTFHRRRAGYARDPSVSDAPEGWLAPVRVGLGLTLWALIGLSVVWPDAIAWSVVPVPPSIRWTGAVVAASMIPLFHWMFLSLGTNITGSVTTRAEHTLVTHGPYRWIRHPLYAFGIVFFVGLSLLLGSVMLGVAVIAMIVLFRRRMRIEEDQLLARFGDEYRQYRARTGRMLPRFR